MTDLPDWINSEAWTGFVAMRKAIKAPLTPRAIALTVGKLDDMRRRGLDPNASLDQSTEYAWRGVFDAVPNRAKATAQLQSFRERDEASKAAAFADPTGMRRQQALQAAGNVIDMEPWNAKRIP